MKVKENSQKKNIHEVAIIGSGPAGLTAAIYTSRARLNPLLLAGVTYGGQLMNTTEVENYPGFPEGIMGPELMQKMIEQAERFGTQIEYEFVNEVDLQNRPFTLWTDKNEYKAKSVIIGVGATPRRLGLESEEKFWGKGVSSCATCDGAFYRDEVVAVVGGGDSAMEESTFLTRFAEKVYIIHRRDEFRASEIMQERALKNPKIEVLWDSEVREVMGDDTVEKLRIENNRTGEMSELEVAGMFLAIGYEPQTDMFKGQVELDEKGYVKARNHVFTNVEGVFVSGDAEDAIYRQAVTAAGTGCRAALEAERYLAETS